MMTTLPAARQQNIIEYLEKNLSLTIQEIAKELGVSSMTIHRDLDKLGMDGLIQKVHGGAVLAQSPISQLVRLQKQSCQMCDQQTDTRATFTLHCEDRSPQRTCCPHCGLMISCSNGTFLASFATDFLYGHIINARDAIYLLQSSVTLCCSPSVLSFSNPEDATSFQSGFGGILMKFFEIRSYLHQSHNKI